MEVSHIPSRGGRRWSLKDIYMTSRGGLNQSLQLGTEFQALVQIRTFVTKLVRIFARIPDFGPNFSKNWSGFGLDFVS